MSLKDSFQDVLKQRQTYVMFLREKKKELERMRDILEKAGAGNIFEVSLEEDTLTIKGKNHRPLTLEYCIKEGYAGIEMGQEHFTGRNRYGDWDGSKLERMLSQHLAELLSQESLDILHNAFTNNMNRNFPTL